MRRTRGFSLVELMVVVAVVSILATIAATSYRRYVARVRVTEVTAMFAEFRAKEEAYRAEYGQYANVTSGDTAPWPCLDQTREPLPKDWASGGVGAQAPVAGCAANFPWAFGRGQTPPGGTLQPGLNITPYRPQVYCTYSLTAGAAGAPLIGAGLSARSSAAYGPTPQVPWWVATALCDSDGFGTPPANGIGSTPITKTDPMTNDSHVFITTSANAALIQLNEGR